MCFNCLSLLISKKSNSRKTRYNCLNFTKTVRLASGHVTVVTRTRKHVVWWPWRESWVTGARLPTTTADHGWRAAAGSDVSWWPGEDYPGCRGTRRFVLDGRTAARSAERQGSWLWWRCGKAARTYTAKQRKDKKQIGENKNMKPKLHA